MNKNGLEIVAVEELTDTGRSYEKCPWIVQGDVCEGRDDLGNDVYYGSTEQTPKSMPQRASWGGKFEFLFTCIGYAVGLGNVWRFPYLCYKNGGGAFLVPYILMLAFVGLPLFFMELCFGQFASLGPITIWRINPLLKGLGYGMVIVSWLISLYYNVIISYVIFYLYASLTSKLPWATCDNYWNTKNCIGYRAGNITGNSTSSSDASKDSTLKTVTAVTTIVQKASTAAEEYYKHYVLERSDSISDFGMVNWKLALCLLIAWVIVGACLLKGVQSLGKVVYFTATFPYLMLTVLLVRGLTLNGAGTGIVYYLKPDFEKLKEPRVWSDAATQIFYSLSACSGGLIAMASFNKFSHNCYRDALIVAILNSATSIYAGFVIFSILGFMAYEKGVSVADVAKQGPGLAFEVYPEALTQLPLPPLWSVFFFLMMATLGFGSQFSIVECVMSAIIDEFRHLLGGRKKNIYFRLILVTISFLLGLPMVCNGGIYLLNLMDFSVCGFPLLFIGLLELIALNWIYGFEYFWNDIVMMIGEKPKLFWKVCWTVISPLVIFVTLLFNVVYYAEPREDDKPFPGWALSMGWLIAMFPMIVVPGWFLFKFCTEGGWQLLKIRAAPLPSWGPALATDRTERYAARDAEPTNLLKNAFLKPEEFTRMIAGSTSTINTGSSLTLATNVGSTFGSV